jgi:hypothetical protein
MGRFPLPDLVKNYSVLIALLSSLILIGIATLLYPGGSLLDQDSQGFGWSRNFLSNLFEAKALNGMDNPGRIWAMIGMAFHSVGYGIFFIHMSEKIPLKSWARILKIIGVINLVLIFLIATPLHDVGTGSIILTLLGLFVVTIFLLKSKLHVLKFYSIACLLAFYVFFFFYGFGYLKWAMILQKVYTISSLLLVLALEYRTSAKDFVWGKGEAAGRE